MHAVDVVEPAEDDFPAGQKEHNVASAADHLPTPHWMEAVDEQKLPAMQPVHADPAFK